TYRSGPSGTGINILLFGPASGSSLFPAPRAESFERLTGPRIWFFSHQYRKCLLRPRPTESSGQRSATHVDHIKFPSGDVRPEGAYALEIIPCEAASESSRRSCVLYPPSEGYRRNK